MDATGKAGRRVGNGIAGRLGGELDPIQRHRAGRQLVPMDAAHHHHLEFGRAGGVVAKGDHVSL